MVAVGVRVDERAAAPAGAALPAGAAPPAGAALALRRRRGDPLVLGHLPVAVGVSPVDPLLVVAPFLAPLRRHFIGREVAVPIFVHRAVLLGVRAHLLVLGTDEGAARGGGVEEGRGAGGGAEVMRRGEGVGSVGGARGEGGRRGRARVLVVVVVLLAVLVLAVVVILLVGRRVVVVVVRVHVTPLILRQLAVLVRVRLLNRHLRRVLPVLLGRRVRVAAGPVRRQLLRREVPVRVRVGAPELVLPAHLHVEPRILERGVPPLPVILLVLTILRIRVRPLLPRDGVVAVGVRPIHRGFRLTLERGGVAVHVGLRPRRLDLLGLDEPVPVPVHDVEGVVLAARERDEEEHRCAVVRPDEHFCAVLGHFASRAHCKFASPSLLSLLSSDSPMLLLAAALGFAPPSDAPPDADVAGLGGPTVRLRDTHALFRRRRAGLRAPATARRRPLRRRPRTHAADASNRRSPSSSSATGAAPPTRRRRRRRRSPTARAWRRSRRT